MKFKMTKEEKHWVLYDVGNSAFVLMVSTIMPIYFYYLANKGGISSVDYLAYWGYAASISTLIGVIIGPILGTMADYKGFKKPIFAISILLGAISCAVLGFTTLWISFLAIFIIAEIGFSSSLIFYDSMLADITTEDRMDNVSSQGYAWGYIGSCVPFILCLFIVLGKDKIGISMKKAMMICFTLVALWWIGMSLMLLKEYKQKNYVPKKQHALRNTFKRLFKTFKNIGKEKEIFMFLLAYFFFIDGVYTIIDMATAYGQALHLNETALLIALLITQFVAWPCTIMFGRLSQKYETVKLIKICIIAYFGITLYASILKSQVQFFTLAILVGVFQGGIQALSRSNFSKIIPKNQSGEYFGILDICGKGASFIGTTLMSVVSQITGDVNKGVFVISLLFIVGFVLFKKSSEERDRFKQEKDQVEEAAI